MEISGLVGLTILLVHGSIFQPLRARFLTSLLSCALCTGFWVGLAGALTHVLQDGVTFRLLYQACTVSVVAFVTSLLIHRLQE